MYTIDESLNASYIDLQVKLLMKIDVVRNLLREHANKFDKAGKDYGFIGDIEKIITDVDNIINFLEPNKEGEK